MDKSGLPWIAMWEIFWNMRNNMEIKSVEIIAKTYYFMQNAIIIL